jgi:ABC-2 type transport system ATP-binding protein
VVEVDDIPRARALLSAEPTVERVLDDGELLRVSLRDPATVPSLNRLLVMAGLSVMRLEPTQASLEQRFLEVTTRLENAA